MGYSIRIGEAFTVVNSDGILEHDVVPETHLAAPAFGEVTDRENKLLPAYGSWLKIVAFCGLEELFWNAVTGLMREEGNPVLLVADHLNIVEEAIEKLRAQYPDAIPRLGREYPESPDEAFLLDDGLIEDESLARILWLQYWIRWAIDNCQEPVILAD